MLRDIDIRQALRASLEDEHAGEADVRVVEELGICQGRARVDLAVINGSINGFEIKSDADRLHRLERQRDAYGTVLDTVTLVCGSRHLREARERIPRWWGVIEAKDSEAGVVLRRRRGCRENRGQDPEAVARLLWREEALALLAGHDLARGMLDKPRRVLWEKLASGLDREELRSGVRAALKRRAGWRSEK
jgi:hypothetical protein